MTDGSATTPQPQAEREPARWSMSWLLKKANWILLGQFRIPGWVGLAFAIFWGLPAWQSKLQFWAGVARSTGGLFVPLAEILTWPYLPVIIAVLSAAYLVAVSRQASPDSPRNTVLASLAWVSLTSIILASIAVAGYGAVEFYIRSQIDKGIAGVPRAGSPADSQKSGTDRALYVDGPRVLTQNQQRLLIEMGDTLQSQLPKSFPITYMTTDMEAFGYAAQLRTTFEHAAIQTNGPIEQPLGKGGLSGVIIEVDDIKSPAGMALQQALETMDIHPKLVANLPRYGNNPLVLFIAPRPVQP